VPTLDAKTFADADMTLYKTGDNTYRFVSTKTYEEISPVISNLGNINSATPFVFTQVSTVGPTLGNEMTKKAIIAIVVVILAILAFIAFSFREVSLPVSSWKYGVIAMVTLLHDIIVPTGVYVILSHKYGAEVDTLFVLALLTILGLSVHDKIVVFDRIRENLKDGERKDFAQTVGISTSQTIVRSINITLTIIFVLVPLYLFGPETTKNFALILTIGLFFGIYSSLFFASPLLILIEGWQRKK